MLAGSCKFGTVWAGLRPINNATEGQPLSVCGRGTRQRGGGCCALVGVGFLPDGRRWAVRNYLFAAALCVVVEKQGQGGMVGRTSSSERGAEEVRKKLGAAQLNRCGRSAEVKVRQKFGRSPEEEVRKKSGGSKCGTLRRKCGTAAEAAKKEEDERPCAMREALFFWLLADFSRARHASAHQVFYVKSAPVSF